MKTRLTFGSASAQANMYGVWSPDGRRIVYSSVRGGKYGFYAKSADGSGSEEVLLEGSSQLKYVTAWSLDGKSLAYQQAGQGNITIQILPLNGKQKPYTFLESQFLENFPVFSPDDKWVAYCSNESGQQKVYVVAFPGPGGKWQISPGGGCVPRWRRDGKEIFYLSSDNKIMAAEVNGRGSSFAIGNVKPLFETRVVRLGVGAFDVTADGQRFIITDAPGESTAAITLVTNWNAEVNKK